MSCHVRTSPGNGSAPVSKDKTLSKTRDVNCPQSPRQGMGMSIDKSNYYPSYERHHYKMLRSTFSHTEVHWKMINCTKRLSLQSGSSFSFQGQSLHIFYWPSARAVLGEYHPEVLAVRTELLRRGLGGTDRAASARSVQERPRADILPVRSRANSVNRRFVARLLVSWKTRMANATSFQRAKIENQTDCVRRISCSI